MRKAEEQLLRIIRCGILKMPEPLIIDEGGCDVLFELALGHVIAGVTFVGIERSMAQYPNETNVHITLLLQMLYEAERLREQKTKYDAVMADFARLMEKEQIDYVVFKGLAVASHYLKPESRDIGDIDFYVPEWDFERAVNAIEKQLNVHIEKDDIDKHFSFNWRGIRFEMHYQIETFGFKQYQQYFNAQVDACLKQQIATFAVNDTQVPMLPPMWDLIVVFKHLMNHLIGEGVGLRQTTDFAVLISCYQQTIDVKDLQEHLSRIGYLKAFSAMVALTERFLSVSWPSYWQTEQSRFREKAFAYSDKLISDILKNGNFGRMDYQHLKNGTAKRLETTIRFFRHCFRYYPLAPKDIIHLIPKRISISLKAH